MSEPRERGPRPPNTDSWQAEAIKKAERLRRAKRKGDDTLRTLAQVGTLAWMFILPVLIAGWTAHFVLRDTSQRWLSLPLLLLGVLVGGALVRRKVQQLLDEGRDDESD
jgi:hypothetical protein